MPNCIKCNTMLADEVRVCPICDAVQTRPFGSEYDNVESRLNSAPSVLYDSETTENNTHANSNGTATPAFDGDVDEEIDRLMKRGAERFKSGKAWLGAKNRPRARKEFQRAFKYYETILKLDPEFGPAKEARAKCLLKMA
jgi:hypothetical protein